MSEDRIFTVDIVGIRNAPTKIANSEVMVDYKFHALEFLSVWYHNKKVL